MSYIFEKQQTLLFTHEDKVFLNGKCVAHLIHYGSGTDWRLFRVVDGLPVHEWPKSPISGLDAARAQVQTLSPLAFCLLD